MSYWSRNYHDWAPRKTAAARRADAARMIASAARGGRAMSPVTVAGRKIAHTFWGKAWCDNLERYRDFAYRLERGRSYLRSGSVIDLRIEAGKIAAKVSGSALYDIAIEIDEVKRDAWRAIQKECAGGIGSRIDLLAGKLSESVMTRLCADRTGLFPHPSAIRFTCSCPDYASMCKHVAAAMYGVGARFDHAPELLFTLRRVSLDELLASAITALPATPQSGRVLAASGLAQLFGIELADAGTPAAPPPPGTRAATTARPPTAKRAKPAASTGKPAAAGKAASAGNTTGSTRRAAASTGKRIATGKTASASKSSANTGKATLHEQRLDALTKQISSTRRRPARMPKEDAPSARKIASMEKQRVSVARRSAPGAKRLASSTKSLAAPAKTSAPTPKQPAPRARARSK
jgi:uncharacterized Zn finger protein